MAAIFLKLEAQSGERTLHLGSQKGAHTAGSQHQALLSPCPSSLCPPPTCLFHLLHRQLQTFTYLQALNLFSLHSSPGRSLPHGLCDVSSIPAPSVQSLGHVALPPCAWGKVQNQLRAKAEASPHAETQQEEGIKSQAGSLSAPRPRAQGHRQGMGPSWAFAPTVPSA